MIKKSQSWMISENEVTPETIFKQRRDILLKLGITATALPFAAQSKAGLLDLFPPMNRVKPLIIAKT